MPPLTFHRSCRVVSYRLFRLALICAAPLVATGAAQACEFAVVKQQIDIVLDQDARLGAEFRKQVKEGADSIAVLETLVSAEMQKQVDICRFHVAEYLTKRGFPPPH